MNGEISYEKEKKRRQNYCCNVFAFFFVVMILLAAGICSYMLTMKYYEVMR